jgi:hypothetical protein
MIKCCKLSLNVTNYDNIAEKSFLNRIFSYLDTLPDYPWINNAEFPVQNLENIPEHDITAQEVLEETILSPAENLLGTTEELDHFFPEDFINLATMESNMNSFNVDHLTNLLVANDAIQNGLGDLLVDTKEVVGCQNACQIPNDFLDDVLKSAPAPKNYIVPEPITDFDTTAVVPDVVPESPLSVADSPADTTDAGDFANSLDLSQLDPAVLALLEKLERPPENNVEANSRKRALEVKEEAPVCKKKRQQSSSSTRTDPEKVVERRVKNNAASRACRASRKAKHNELFQLEQELSEENKVLTSQVNELTTTVEYLRNYLISRLSGQCN